MKTYEKLLLNNKAWAEEKIQIDGNYFQELAKGQEPNILWIGSADSRVPESTITGTDPGDIFVHRNIANLVVNTDLNLISILQYAVEHLKVEHVIVCGHYGCGGIQAALSNQDFGLLNKWLRNIKDVYRLYEKELEAIKNEKERLDRMVELNVREQVLNLSEMSIIQKAWKKNNSPILHGWVYNVEDGLLKDLCLMDSESEIPEIYRLDLE